MSLCDQQHASPPAHPTPITAYPPPGQSYPLGTRSFPPTIATPPPAGYPIMDGAPYPQQIAIETKSRGDGFWKGCFAALCCCCVLDMCID